MTAPSSGLPTLELEAAAEAGRLSAQARDDSARRLGSATSINAGDAALHDLSFALKRIDRMDTAALLQSSLARQQRMRDTALGVLVQAGWEPFPGGPALATKIFDTAVGPKQAAVHFSWGSADDGFAGLNATYHSEGRNVLESTLCLIGKGDDPNAVARTVQAWAAAADAAVLDSYAARLAQRWPRERG